VATKRPGPPRRLAIVTQDFTSLGGVSSVTNWLRTGLTAEGYEVDVHDLATSSNDPSSRRIASPSTWHSRSLRGPYAPAERVQKWGANAVELEPIRYFPRSELSDAIRHYDVIQVVAGGAALANAVIGVGPPVFVQVATRVRWERRTRRATLPPLTRIWGDAMTAWTSHLESKALRTVDGVFVENTEMLKYSLSTGQKNARLAPPGVDTQRFHPSGTGWRPSGYLLSVCRLAEPRKRLDRLIMAYHYLVQKDGNTPDLVMAGRGALPNDMRQLINRLGLNSRVIVENDIPVEGLPELYRNASVYVQTSSEEGLGISVLEAMASGLPVVSTDTAGARQCVANMLTGYLISMDTESLTIQGIAEKIQSTRTTSAGGRMALEARKRCEQGFSSARALRQFTMAYDQCLADRPPQSVKPTVA